MLEKNANSLLEGIKFMARRTKKKKKKKNISKKTGLEEN